MYGHNEACSHASCIRISEHVIMYYLFCSYMWLSCITIHNHYLPPSDTYLSLTHLPFPVPSDILIIVLLLTPHSSHLQTNSKRTNGEHSHHNTHNGLTDLDACGKTLGRVRSRVSTGSRARPRAGAGTEARAGARARAGAHSSARVSAGRATSGSSAARSCSARGAAAAATSADTRAHSAHAAHHGQVFAGLACAFDARCGFGANGRRVAALAGKVREGAACCGSGGCDTALSTSGNGECD